MQLISKIVLVLTLVLTSSCGSGNQGVRSAVPPEIGAIVAGSRDACIVVVGELGNLNYLTIEPDGTKNSGFLTVPIGNDWEHDLERGIDSVASGGRSILVGCTKDADLTHLTLRARQDIKRLAGPVRLWVRDGETWHEELNLAIASPPPTAADLGTLMSLESGGT